MHKQQIVVLEKVAASNNCSLRHLQLLCSQHTDYIYYCCTMCLCCAPGNLRRVACVCCTERLRCSVGGPEFLDEFVYRARGPGPGLLGGRIGGQGYVKKFYVWYIPTNPLLHQFLVTRAACTDDQREGPVETSLGCQRSGVGETSVGRLRRVIDYHFAESMEEVSMSTFSGITAVAVGGRQGWQTKPGTPTAVSIFHMKSCILEKNHPLPQSAPSPVEESRSPQPPDGPLPYALSRGLRFNVYGFARCCPVLPRCSNSFTHGPHTVRHSSRLTAARGLLAAVVVSNVLHLCWWSSICFPANTRDRTRESRSSSVTAVGADDHL